MHPTKLEQIKSKIVISAFASSALGLEVTRGRTMRCHIHNENTPSLHFNDEKRFYHCFGCKISGDVFDLVREVKGVDFKEAIRFVADYADIDISEEDLIQNPEHSKIELKKKQLFSIAEKATLFFEKNLSEKCIEYMKARGISKDSIKKFRLGFCPKFQNSDTLAKIYSQISENWRNLTEEMGILKIFGQEIRSSLLGGRIIFPIADKFNRVIAFGGRIIDTEDDSFSSQINRPKYLNTKESLIFHKREVLYGENFAYKEARKFGYLLIVEGFFDLLALHQASFPNVLATMGTSLTPSHLDTAFAISKTLIFAFDGDSAGRRAILKTIDLVLPLVKPGQFCKFIQLNKNVDPAEFIQTTGAEAFAEKINNALNLSSVIFRALKSKYQKISTETISALRHDLASKIHLIKDEILKVEYKEFFSLQIDELKLELRQNSSLLSQHNSQFFKKDRLFPQQTTVFEEVISFGFYLIQKFNPKNSENYIIMLEKHIPKSKFQKVFWRILEIFRKNRETFNLKDFTKIEPKIFELIMHAEKLVDLQRINSFEKNWEIFVAKRIKSIEVKSRRAKFLASLDLETSKNAKELTNILAEERNLLK